MFLTQNQRPKETSALAVRASVPVTFLPQLFFYRFIAKSDHVRRKDCTLKRKTVMTDAII